MRTSGSLEENAEDAEQHRIEVLGPADQQAQRCAHGAEVRAQVDNVRHDQQDDDGTQKPCRVVTPQVLGDALAGDAADAGADRLDHRHQREAEQHGPGEAIAELGAHLAVGGDTAGIIVGGAGDEAGAQAFQEAQGLQLRTRLRRAAGRAFLTGCMHSRVSHAPFVRELVMVRG